MFIEPDDISSNLAPFEFNSIPVSLTGELWEATVSLYD